MATPSGVAAAGVARPGPDDPSAPPPPPGASQASAPGALGEPPAPSPAPPPGPAAAPGGPPPPAPPQQPSPAAEAKYPAAPAQPPPPSAASASAAAAAPPPASLAAAPPSAAGAVPQHLGQEDYSFLPLVHDVIKCMDKDSPDVHQVLNELRTKFVEMRKLVKALQGIGASPEQQQLQLQNLREQVKTKSELLQKYKSLCMFEIPKE
ncbi:hypothetical protein JRQ81_010336 [Phrynocephalus forsythii]|uniref:Mediator of RNA polymerase II transcription subunit 9 n=1 Tax=Phrynocephalus forsythii TaxID=171643 RepID=A0A9Q0X8C5_9SAUR|nr:hypothetical protein JRQ81_010336 [Phrynocephalus forsythii]